MYDFSPPETPIEGEVVIVLSMGEDMDMSRLENREKEVSLNFSV